MLHIFLHVFEKFSSVSQSTQVFLVHYCSVLKKMANFSEWLGEIADETGNVNLSQIIKGL